MDLVAITPKYYEFVRALRTDPRTQSGFIQEISISHEDQIRYMKEYSKNYYVCLLHEQPAGYVGVIDEDIRICTHPNFQRKGVGFFMLSEVKKLYPLATGRIKRENTASQLLFEKCGVGYSVL